MRTLDIQIKINNYQTLIQSQCINIKQLRIKKCPNIYFLRLKLQFCEKSFLVLEVFGAIMQFFHSCAD